MYRQRMACFACFVVPVTANCLQIGTSSRIRSPNCSPVATSKFQHVSLISWYLPMILHFIKTQTNIITLSTVRTLNLTDQKTISCNVRAQETLSHNMQEYPEDCTVCRKT
jgi:hypothetical protein